MTVTAADVLRGAMERITPEGAWIQGEASRFASSTHPAGSCSTDAMFYAMERLGIVNQPTSVGLVAFKAFKQAIDLPIDGNIPDWNDDPSRTHEDVLLAFKRAIEIAEESR